MVGTERVSPSGEERGPDVPAPCQAPAPTIEAAELVDLPESLKAKIVDPQSFFEVPVIDLRLDEATLVEQLRYASEVVGFMQVVGHGVSEELQKRQLEVQKRFFDLPADSKARLALDTESPVRGYFGQGGEDLDRVVLKEVDAAAGKKVAAQTRTDFKEALDMNGVPWSKAKGGYVADIFSRPSRLPAEEEVPGFQEVVEEYAREMFRLAQRILSLMALVLGKPRNFFDQYMTAPVATHRLLHYWPIRDFKTQIGVGEHTDYGLLTILNQDSVGGLQVLNGKDHKWVHCPPIPNAMVVNIGDMLGRWTAHRFKSTVHRVVNVSSFERYSVPYFLEPNMDTRIVPGGLCEGPGPSLVEAVEGGALSEHQRRCRLRAQWGRTRSCQKAATAEEILERFYRASGQLRERAPAEGLRAAAAA